MMLNIFSCAFWPSVCLPWRDVCLSIHPFFDWIVCSFFDIELHELFVYFGDQSFVCCFIWKYFLPFSGLSFCLVYDFLCRAKTFKFN